MNYELDRVNKAIAECLAGAGGFDDLKRLRAEKAEIEEKAYFDKVQSLKAEIQMLEAQRVVDYEDLRELELDLQIAAKQVDKQSEILLQAREAHAQTNGEIYLKRITIDNNKAIVKEKTAELNNLIKDKTEQI